MDIAEFEKLFITAVDIMFKGSDFSWSLTLGRSCLPEYLVRLSLLEDSDHFLTGHFKSQSLV